MKFISSLHVGAAWMTFSGGERQRAIEGLVSELRATSETLEEAMRVELARSSQKRIGDALYPAAARQLSARIANLKATIAALEFEATA